MVNKEIAKQSLKLLDAITRYEESKSKLKAFHRHYSKKHPLIAQHIQDEIDKIQQNIDGLQQTRKFLLGKGDVSEDFASKNFSADKVEEQIKNAGKVELDEKTLEQMKNDIIKIKDNTSHQKRDMLITGIISFVAGILSTLLIQVLFPE